MFAIELMMPEVSVRTFLPVALATGTATFVGNWFLGPQPAFAVPTLPALAHQPSAMVALGLYALLGAVMGVAAAAFVRALSAAEDVLRANREPVSAAHAIGMLLVGILIYVLFHFYGHYYVEGRRLRDDSSAAHRPASAARYTAAALRRQTRRHLDSVSARARRAAFSRRRFTWARRWAAHSGLWSA